MMRKMFFGLFLLLGSLGAEEIPVSGTLFPRMSTKISSQVQGRVQEVYVGTGAHVKKGEVLAKIDPTTFEFEVKKCKSALELAELAYQDAQVNHTRMHNLWNKESSAIPKSQYDSAVSELKKAKVAFEQAKLTLEQMEHRLSETKIKAPYKGVITNRFVDPGESVGGAPLFEIMDTATLVFEFTLPQTLLGKVKEGQKVSSESLDGVIFSVLPQVSEMSRALRCRMTVPNDTYTLKPGLFMTATLHIDEES